MKVTVDILDAISQVSATQWDALLDADEAFATHAFLSTLEKSGSVGQGTGWQPCHIVCRNPENPEELLGAMPLYIKSHSYGEYIFDWQWADGAQRAGIPYYPKLVSAIPFTPATGARLFVSSHLSEIEQGTLQSLLLESAVEIAQEIGASSVHWLCVDAKEPPSLEGEQILPRQTMQFHWNNPWNAASSNTQQDPVVACDFEKWLGLFSSVDRKKIRAERRKAQNAVDKTYCLRGTELTDAHIESIWQSYQDTSSRKWGKPYLTREFFLELSGALADLVWVFFAEKQDRIVAMSLCFQRGRALFGRYWGCLEELDSVHFELCYHQPIELCLQQGWVKFEAGAQGEHKLKRGLLPAPIYSWHWISHRGLSQAIERYIQSETRAVQEEMAYFSQHSPLR